MSARAKVSTIFLMPLVALITMGDICDDGGGSSGQYSETPPDACPSWDTDCDDISNAVETNDANSYLHLDPSRYDNNPSLALGWPCSTQCVGLNCGWISYALNMVNTGTGYYHYNPEKALLEALIDSDDWGVLHLINMIEGAGRDWYDWNHIPPRIGVGDLSKGDANTSSFGAYFSPHVCHQNGTEADFRYVRSDGLEIALNLMTNDSAFFDIYATRDLFNALFNHADAIKIYVGTFLRGKIEFEGIDTVYDAYHNDHFHLRIQDPDGTGN